MPRISLMLNRIKKWLVKSNKHRIFFSHLSSLMFSKKKKKKKKDLMNKKVYFDCYLIKN